MPKEQKRLASTTVEAVNNLASLWDQIDQARASAGIQGVQMRRPGGVTVSEYAARYGVGLQTAQRHLGQLAKDGLMVAERAVVVAPGGKRAHATVYYPATK